MKYSFNILYKLSKICTMRKKTNKLSRTAKKSSVVNKFQLIRLFYHFWRYYNKRGLSCSRDKKSISESLLFCVLTALIEVFNNFIYNRHLHYCFQQRALLMNFLMKFSQLTHFRLFNLILRNYVLTFQTPSLRMYSHNNDLIF